MKLALIGLANSGKTTLFNALTGQNVETTLYTTTTGDPHIGVVRVPDRRVDELARIYRPRKTTYATVEYVDFHGLTKGDPVQNRRVFDLIKDSDALVNVIRGFDDDAVVHPLESLNPVRDFETMETELIFSDLELIEKRLERIEESKKKGKKTDKREHTILLKCKDILEKEVPLRYAFFNNEERKVLRHLQFVSMLPLITVITVSEEDLNNDKAKRWNAELLDFYKRYPGDDMGSPIFLCGKIEMEIAQLSPDEAEEFLHDLGVDEAARNRLIRESYRLLGYISFLTTGEDEVRAWTIKEGIDAHTAAGKIHSDIQRGFIRAEVISFEDFIASGSMSVAKQKGLSRLEGKTYIVQDGDIINFRFNV